MVEIKISGMIYTFEDDWKVIEWLDANADAAREADYSCGAKMDGGEEHEAD